MKKFNIQISYDEEVMEIKNIKYPTKFTNLNSLAKADLLLDLIEESWKLKDRNMQTYLKELKRRQKNDR
jgi:hypothetical protein|tara:strand:+ start:433 stop:639 length:207 start_codon:yes stop_codon:yes gene_type:complete